MKKITAYGAAILVSIVSLGAASGPNNSKISKDLIAKNEAPVVEKKAPIKQHEVGTASWYGSDFDGKPTASGEPYDMYDLTAAHPTLPLGTNVRVTNLRNGKALIVRINDRGPYVPGRIIDLSYGAAQVLDVQDRGLQRVRIDVIKNKKQAKVQTATPVHPLA